MSSEMYYEGLHEEIHEFVWKGDGQVSYQTVMNLKAKETAPHQESSETEMLDVVAVVVRVYSSHLRVHLEKRGCRVGWV